MDLVRNPMIPSAFVDEFDLVIEGYGLTDMSDVRLASCKRIRLDGSKLELAYMWIDTLTTLHTLNDIMNEHREYPAPAQDKSFMDVHKYISKILDPIGHQLFEGYDMEVIFQLANQNWFIDWNTYTHKMDRAA